ncbi:MAG TPA: geranylgeranylglycerol-phosphate geranylgeranyltransferase [Bacteroidales bacterium]|nr:geranylgeranylglycerol-phosphate geranylgeranyltransferase [Bacteroidales bacterium]
MAGFDIIWRLIRFPNLLLIALTQSLVWFSLLKPVILDSNLTPYLSTFEFILYVLCTVLIAAGGNAVNDLYDVKVDQINKPESQIVGRWISIEDTYRIYVIIVLAGALIAGYLSYELGRLILFISYPFIVFFLWAYSKWFKRLPFTGNTMVSLFVASVPIVLLVPEWRNILQPEVFYSLSHKLIWSFTFFCFGVNILREYVKDIESVKGDLKAGAVTLPAVIGPQRAKLYAILFSSILFIGFIFWGVLIYDKVSTFNFIYFLTFLISPLAIIIFLLSRAKIKSDYHRVNRGIKILIVLGLLYILLF